MIKGCCMQMSDPEIHLPARGKVYDRAGDAYRKMPVRHWAAR